MGHTRCTNALVPGEKPVDRLTTCPNPTATLQEIATAATYDSRFCKNDQDIGESLLAMLSVDISLLALRYA